MLLYVLDECNVPSFTAMSFIHISYFKSCIADAGGGEGSSQQSSGTAVAGEVVAAGDSQQEATSAARVQEHVHGS